MTEFLRRTYHELVRDTLTRLVGGVVGEQFVFAPHSNEAGYALAQSPVSSLIRIGVRTGDELRELPVGSAELNADRTRFTISTNGLVGDGATILVDYLPHGNQSPLTDTHVGSVSRTLVESISHELARFYQKLDRVYRSGFVDTAERTALDQIVTLLGVERIRAGRPVVTVTFQRSAPAVADLPIPAGTVVSTGIDAEGGEARFVTLNDQIMLMGTSEVDALAQATIGSVLVAASVASGALRVMPRPVAGIDRVTNHAPAFHSQTDESDEALRLRAKLALQGAGKVTIEALRSAILDEGALSVVLSDMPRGLPGEVEAFIDLPEVRGRSHKARTPGPHSACN